MSLPTSVQIVPGNLVLSGNVHTNDTDNTFCIDRANGIVGIGQSLTSLVTGINDSNVLQISGEVTATKFHGDGRGITGLTDSKWLEDDNVVNNIHYSLGNVGIGGAANTNKLKVHGTVEASSFSGILATDVPTLDTSKISGLGSFATLSSYPTVTQTDFRWTMGGTGITSHANYGGHGDWYIRSNHGSGKVILQDTGGKVGVGTSNPIAKLHVNGSAGFTINTGWLTYFGPYGGNLSHNSNSSWGGGGSIYATSHICTQGYHVSGSGSITASDSRIKKEIVDVEDVAALEILRLLKPKNTNMLMRLSVGLNPCGVSSPKRCVILCLTPHT